MTAAIGGGIVQCITIPLGEQRTKLSLSARMRVFKQGIGVVLNPEEFAGMIVVPRWEELQKLIAAGASPKNFRWRSEHLNYEALGGVYHAYRQTWHILAKYGLDLTSGEKAKMETVRQLARELNLTLLGLAPGARVAEARRATTEAVKTFTATIGEPRTLPKAAAKEQILAAARGADSRERPNPSALMARARAAERNLEERLEDVMAIDPHIVARQKTLLNMIQLAELRLEGLDHFLELLFRRNGLLPLLDPRKRKVVATQLEYFAQELDRIDFHPYRNACQNTARDLRETRDFIRVAARMDSAAMLTIRHSLARARSSVAIKGLQKEIERLIFILTRALILNEKRIATRRIGEMVSRIEERLDGTTASLVKIDDHDFRHPVCAQGASLLRLAEDELASFCKGGNLKQLANAREILKRASAAL